MLLGRDQPKFKRVLMLCVSMYWFTSLKQILNNHPQGSWPVMADEGYVVRIRGLPWSCSVDEVQRFFAGTYKLLFVLRILTLKMQLEIIVCFDSRLQNLEQWRRHPFHLHERGTSQRRGICRIWDRRRPEDRSEKGQRNYGSQICRGCVQMSSFLMNAVYVSSLSWDE